MRAGYPENPESIGEHIRKRRMDLGLFQREAAGVIGVKECSIYNWERGVEPELRFIPKIIDFLGYVPFGCPVGTLGRLGYYKLINGLSYAGLAVQVGIHNEQLQAWLTGRTKPSPKSLSRLEAFLK
ncbi:hypothetical protein RW64_11940 [Geobacter sulfurreducens]|nr:hypothetical protein RW64_11940 [Geobacter sulfurreducens]